MLLTLLDESTSEEARWIDFNEALWPQVLSLPARPRRIVEKILSRCKIVDNGYSEGPCLIWDGPTSGAPGRGQDKGRGHSTAA